MSILDATAAPTLKGNIENESIPREQAEQMLQDLINDMNDQNFDSIKYASYRTGAKLSFIMSKTNLNLVDIYNMIEAFRENGLHILDHDSEIHESRLEAVLSSIFYALNKRIPSTTDIDVERCIALVKHWLLYAYDSDANDRIRVLSVKASLSMLCSGRQVDKLRYVFSQVSEQNGKLNFTKFEGYLKEILKLPEAVGESPTFGFNEDVVNSFFRPTGPLRQDATTLEHFLDCILASDPPPSLLWLTAFHKIVHASRAKHDVACKVCKKSPFKGLRYKCLRCVGYTLCQDCFWRGRVAGSHAADHDTREYSTWNEGEKGTRLSAGKISDPLPPKVPDYPEEPNPDQTMDMTHIVPPVQNDYSAMNGVSHSTPSSSGKLSDPDSSDSRMDDEHKLIARYAARLAESTDGGPNTKKTSAELREDLEQNKAKRKIINDLQSKNREILEEIRNLREVREAAADQPNGTTTDPAQMEELKGLRQKKDELELRMSALQETRKELMSQLEGLMSILKAGSPRTRSTPNSPSTVPRNPDYNIRSSPDQTPGHSSVHGKGHPSHQGRNLRNDLMHAADNVTNAMSSLVNELTSEDDDDDMNNNIRSNGMPPIITADHTSRPIPAEG